MLRALASKLFGGNRESKSLAKSRLHFVLVQDRTGLSNDQMAHFRGELVEVIQRYFVIDEQGFDIAYERQEESTTLVINSPVVVRRQESPKGRVGKDAVQGRQNHSRPLNGSRVAVESDGDVSLSREKRKATTKTIGAKTTGSKTPTGKRSGSRRSRRRRKPSATANG